MSIAASASELGAQRLADTVLAEHRSAIVAGCQQLLASGLLRGTSGNLSIRDQKSQAIAITPTGIDYPAMTAADVPVLDADGDRLDGALLPSSEWALHLAIYRRRPDVGAVVHTHSVFATTFAVLGEPVPPVHYLLARGGSDWLPVPVARYARYGSLELADNCVRTLADGNAVLLANHGLVAVGATLAAAVALADAVEYTAELAWRARQIGQPRVLNADQLAAAAEAFGSYGQSYGQPSSDSGE